MDFIGDIIEVSGRFARGSTLNLFDVMGNSVYRFVSEVLGAHAPTTLKDPYQSAANVFVFAASPLQI
jgi:hypothetical protein